MNYDIREAVRPPTIGRAVLVVVLLVLIAPFVVYAVPATVGAEASYVVLTASMTPAIAPGDVVVVDSVPARSVAVGDVIVFEQRVGDAIPITHRVIEIEQSAAGPSFRTKGDANEDADLTAVTPDRLIGRVVVTIPLIGHVVQFVGTPAGFVTLVVVPLGLLVVSEVADLLRAGRPDAVAATDASDADPSVSTSSDAADATATAVGPGPDDQVVVTPTDLTLTSIALGGFTVYAGYAAVREPTTLSVTLAVAGAALFALAAGIRLFATADESAADRLTTVPSVHVDASRSTGPTVDVSAPSDLSDIAAALGRPILRDDRDRYVVLDGTVTYGCDVPAEADASDDAETAVDHRPEPTADASDGASPVPESVAPTATESGGASR